VAIVITDTTSYVRILVDGMGLTSLEAHAKFVAFGGLMKLA
jgi:hypothetical protein